MSRRMHFVVCVLTAVLIATISSPVLQAQERPEERPAKPGRRRERPEMPERRGMPEGRNRDFRARMRGFYEKRQMERIMRNMAEGQPIEPHMERLLESWSGKFLFRAAPMNAIVSAHYSVAEIYLRQGKHTACLKRLQQVLDGAKGEEGETVWVTHLNMADICRKQVGDMQQALEHYKRVKGNWAAYARRQLLRTFEEMGQLDDAVALLKKEHKEADEKGAKLALMRSIAELYERNQEHEKAVEYYNRITREFTPEDLQAMVKAAKDYVNERTDKVLELRTQRRFEEAERLIHEATRRLAALRAQGRREEAEAMQQAIHAARERIEEQERARRPHEVRHDDDEPPP